MPTLKTSLTSSLLVETKGFCIDPYATHSVGIELLPGDQPRVSAVIQQQAYEGRFTTVSQNCIQQTRGQAPGQRLLAHGAGVVVVWVGPGLKKHPETVEVVIRGADVKRTDHQSRQNAGTEQGSGAQLVVNVDVSVEPACVPGDIAASEPQCFPSKRKSSGGKISHTTSVHFIFGTKNAIELISDAIYVLGFISED